MSRSQFVDFVKCLFVLLTLTGCTQTIQLHDDSLPDSESVIIKQASSFSSPFGWAIIITKIDRQEVERVDQYKLSPGWHEIYTKTMTSNMYLPLREFGCICEVLLLDSEPGHEYQIQFRGYYTKKGEPAPWFTWMPIPWVEIKDLMTDDILDKSRCEESYVEWGW